MQRWDRIEAFVEVVRLGTFSAAARQLKVSNSHVSRLIGQLENQLSTQLLYRTTRQIRLTDAGERYYEHCHTLFEGFREAEAAISDFQARPRGVLKLTAGGYFGERYIAPLANDFQRLHEGLELSLHFTNRRVDLVDEGYDLAIRTGVLKDSSLIARRLCPRREYVVATPEYLARAGVPQCPEDLHRHDCLMGSRDTWMLQENGLRRDIRVRGRWRGNSGLALLDAALKGLGLAQLPDYLVEDALAAGQLVAVLDDCRHRDTAVWAVYPRHRHLSPKVRQFVDYLVEHLPANLSDKGL